MNDSVVIVDDSLTVRMDLVEAFTSAGLQPIPCGSAAEARRMLARMPGVVVLDVVLPDGDGIELLQEIRSSAEGATVVVVMLSAEAEVRDRVRALQVGADEYVGKPYDRSYVVAKVRELLRAREAMSGKATATRPTILIIDDSVTFREELRRAVEGAGYAAITTATGEDGLRIAADRRPNVIVVDGILPGIDGATVIRRLRLDAALRGTPCLLMTAAADRDTELRALDAGADAFVRKGEPVDIVLARIAAALRSSATPPGPTTSLSGPRKVLAVDDSATYLQQLATTLRCEGYDVVLARSGEEALELLAVQTVDCILLDLLMPGLGGRETCQRIKSAPVMRDIPLIMLTALEDRASMLEGLGAGADDYIPKSSELAVLVARVRAQIRRKQFEDENRHIREQLLRREYETAEARAARELADARAALAEHLERRNQELEAFSYTVSHDLRAPLRAIDGFSTALLEDYGDRLDDVGRDYLRRVRSSTKRMANLIDDLLELSRVGHAELQVGDVDLAEIAHSIIEQLREREPQRRSEVTIPHALVVRGDPGLLRGALENLLGNAWKFTSRQEVAMIELGIVERERERCYFVRDNGVGFEPAAAGTLFRPFQRLHSASDFEGTGIGLATVARIVARHDGRVWAEAAPGRGATLYFTLEART